MRRRSHKKSRAGCSECKRRHVKCDETRPTCVNCATAERPWACSYPSAGVRGSHGGGGSINVSGRQSVSGDASPASSSAPSGGPAVLPWEAAQHEVFPDEDEDVDVDVDVDVPSVNMLHLELFNHFMTETSKFASMKSDLFNLSRDIGVKHAFAAPYLMHQLLAIAARHLAILRPERGAFYHHEAIRLQTRALSLFNRSSIEVVGGSDGIAVFMFSAWLGHHALCDTLSSRDEDFASFLAKFVGYLHLHRGVHKVVRGGTWERLLQSELKPVLEMGSAYSSVKGEGHECDTLRQRISRPGRLDEAPMAACENAINFFQWIVDAQSRREDGAHVLMSWALLIPERFVELLAEAEAEAIAVLAYYGALLHSYRDIWIVGDAGQYVVRSIARYLGPDWSDVMAWPIAALADPA